MFEYWGIVILFDFDFERGYFDQGFPALEMGFHSLWILM